MILKIQVLSDLKMELTKYQPIHLESVDEDLVVRAGGIGMDIDGIEWAKDRPMLMNWSRPQQGPIADG